MLRCVGTGRLDRLRFQAALSYVFGQLAQLVPQPDATWFLGLSGVLLGPVGLGVDILMKSKHLE